ncbi:MAG: glycosyltransferase [Phycisphaerales bacterium]
MLFPFESPGPPLPSPRTLVCFGHERAYYRDVIVSERETYVSLDARPGVEGEVQPESRLYDAEKLVASLPSERRPDLIVTRIDATLRCAPVNVAALGIPSVLVVGDTHHQSTPIRTCLAYAMTNPHDLVIGEFNRQHLHFFQEAGVRNVRWLPSFTLSPCERIRATSPVHQCGFAGQAGPSHPYRFSVLSDLERRGVSVKRLLGTRDQAADLYAQSNCTLNVSLNGDFNLRVFETMAAGGTLVTDRLTPESGLDKLFKEGTDLVTFGHPSELPGIIERLAQSPQEAVRIARSGTERYRALHTPHHRRRQLFDLLRNGQEEPAFSLHAPVRPPGATPMGDILELRIGLYELVQELHRMSAELHLLYWPSIDTRFATDMLDLPRARVALAALTAELSAGRAPPSVTDWRSAELAQRVTRLDLRGMALPPVRMGLAVCAAADATSPTMAYLLGAGVIDAVAVLDTLNNPRLGLQVSQTLARMGAHPWITQPLIMSAMPGRARRDLL